VLSVSVFRIFVALLFLLLLLLLLLLLVNLVAESPVNLSYLLFYVVSFVCLFVWVFTYFVLCLSFLEVESHYLCLVDLASEFLNREYSKAKM